MKTISESTIRMASEVNIRRLARYCGVQEWNTLPLLQLIDELGWKDVVSTRYRKGMY